MVDREKVLVTGGAGFVGSHVVEGLVSAGCRVTVLDNLSTGKLGNIDESLRTGGARFVEGDVLDLKVVEECVEGVDAVIHLAGVASVPLSVENPALTYKTNVNGTLNLLNSCVRAKVGRFVFASSCAVYGEPRRLPVKESYVTRPVSPYAISKVQAERRCVDFQEKKVLKTVILRLFNVYGPRQAATEYAGVITSFVDRVRRGLPLVVYGDGTQTRDFIHVRDVVDAFLRVLEVKKAEGRVFNVGSGKRVSVNELAKNVLELAGLDLPIVYKKPREGDLKHMFADVSKAIRLLGYGAKVTLEDGLRTVFGSSTTASDETERLLPQD
jgi:UDP-glucose 4-epimerase